MPLSDDILAEIDRLLAESDERREALLDVLLTIQAGRGGIDDEAADAVAERLGLTRADIEDVVSFYPALSHDRRGRYVIRVCHTLPCALVGGEAAATYVADRLGVALGGTTPDGRFTLLAAECLGLCEQGPAMMINDTVYGRLTPERIDEILGSLD